MSDRCNKCRVSRRSEGNAWCLGCLSWEALERELTGSWAGPAGLRVIADNLVLGAAREVRALRALGAGLGQAPGSGAGSLPSGHRAPGPVKEETTEPLVGATAKKKPDGEAEDSEEYETEESEEEEPEEKDQLAQPVVAPETDRRPELPRRSRAPDQAGGRKERIEPPRSSHVERARSRSRRRREDTKDKRRERDSDKRRDRRDPGEVDPKRSERSAHRTGGKKKKKKRGGRKHKRLGRLEADPYRAIHRSLDKSFLERRERLDRSPLP